MLFVIIGKADQDSYTAGVDLTRLWVHECERVFRDRIISAFEMEALDSMMAETAKKHLSEFQVRRPCYLLDENHEPSSNAFVKCFSWLFGGLSNFRTHTTVGMNEDTSISNANRVRLSHEVDRACCIQVRFKIAPSPCVLRNVRQKCSSRP